MIFVSLICLWSVNQVVFSQQTTLTAGGDAVGSNGSVSYSIGQVVFSVTNNENASINEGVQQPYIILLTTGSMEDVSLKCKAFPNPTVDVLHLVTGDLEGCEYSLYTDSGQKLTTKPILSTNTEINMSTYKAGVYILRVKSAHKEYKTFKILKQ